MSDVLISIVALERNMTGKQAWRTLYAHVRDTSFFLKKAHIKLWPYFWPFTFFGGAFLSRDAKVSTGGAKVSTGGGKVSRGCAPTRTPPENPPMFQTFLGGARPWTPLPRVIFGVRRLTCNLSHLFLWSSPFHLDQRSMSATINKFTSLLVDSVILTVARIRKILNCTYHFILSKRSSFISQ